MMKKNYTFILAFVLLASTSLNAQNLFVGSDGVLSVSANQTLYVNNNVTINTGGDLTIHSDANNYGSFITSGNVTGHISYKKYIKNTDWNLISAPVVGQSVTDFVNPSNNNKILHNSSNQNYAIGVYDNTKTKRWVYHNESPSKSNQQTLNDFISGLGYTMKRTSVGIFTYTGSVATTDVSIPINAPNQDHRWTVIGNPFPAFLPANYGASQSTANLLSQNAANLAPSHTAIYLWDGKDHVAYNMLSAPTHIAPGQAFFIHGKGDNQNFTFPKNFQKPQPTIVVSKRKKIPSIIVKLSVGKQYKTTELKYVKNASLGLDVGYDAGAYKNNISDFSIDSQLIKENQGIDFTLQCLPDNAYETTVVPLSVKATANSTLTFNANTTNLPIGMDVYLEDNVKNTFTKINKKDYHVTISNNTNGIGRFYLHTSTKVLENNPYVAKNISIHLSNKSTLTIKGLHEKEATSLQLYTIAGQQVFTTNFKANNIHKLRIPNALPAGMYIVKLTSKNNNKTKKIIIN